MILGCSLTMSYGQSIEKNYSEDVKSIDAIIDAYYDVVSGSSDKPWEFDRDKFLHDPNALIVRIDEKGNADTHSLEAEYIPILLEPREDLYEIELKRIVNTYENMAQV